MASLSAPPVDESAPGRTWSWLLGWAGAQHISARRSHQPQRPPSLPPSTTATATAKTPTPFLLAAEPTHPIPARLSSERQRPLSHCGIYDIPIYQPPVFQHSNSSAPLVGLTSAPSGSTIHAQHRRRRSRSSERAAMTQPTQSADRTSKPLPELPPPQSRDTPAAGQSDRVRKSGSLHRRCPSSPTLSTMLGTAPSTAVVTRQWSLRRPASVPLQSGNHDFSIFRRATADEQNPSQDDIAVGGEEKGLCPAEAEPFPDDNDDFAGTKDTQYVSGGDWDFDREEDSMCYVDAIGYDLDPEPSPFPSAFPSPRFVPTPTLGSTSDGLAVHGRGKQDSWLDFFEPHRNSMRRVPPSPTLSARSSVASDTLTAVHSETATSDDRHDSLGAHTFCETLSSWCQQLDQESPLAKVLPVGSASDLGERPHRFPRRISSLSPVWFSWLEGRVANGEVEVEKIPRPASPPISPPPRVYGSSQSQAVLQSGVSLQRKSYIAQRESTEVMSTAVMRRLATLLYDFTLQPPVRHKVVPMLEIPNAGATENLQPCDPAHKSPSPEMEQKEPERKARKKKSKFWLAMCCTR